MRTSILLIVINMVVGGLLAAMVAEASFLHVDAVSSSIKPFSTYVLPPCLLYSSECGMVPPSTESSEGSAACGSAPDSSTPTTSACCCVSPATPTCCELRECTTELLLLSVSGLTSSTPGSPGFPARQPDLSASAARGFAVMPPELLLMRRCFFSTLKCFTPPCLHPSHGDLSRDGGRCSPFWWGPVTIRWGPSTIMRVGFNCGGRHAAPSRGHRCSIGWIGAQDVYMAQRGPFVQPPVMLDHVLFRQLVFRCWLDDSALPRVFGVSCFYLWRRHQHYTSVVGILLLRRLLWPTSDRRFARSIHPGARVFDAPAYTPHQQNRFLLLLNRRCYLFIRSFDLNVTRSSFEDLM